nr:DUF2244 domain-containing protein [Roseitranquillus sediminis]
MLRLHLWPHRSLSANGFVTFVGATAALLAVPLLPLIGTVLVWMLLPFLLGALALVWVALRVSAAQGRLTETLSLAPRRVELVRREVHGDERLWSADPAWVSVHLHRTGGPVENYLTLRGGAREVEIGAFLSAEERLALHSELESALIRIKRTCGAERSAATLSAL